MATGYTPPLIKPREAAEVLHFYSHDEGKDGGLYLELLIQLAIVTNQEQLEKLASIHPGHIAAFQLVRQSVTGLQGLRIIASLEFAANS